jgi:hypothetical protein
MTTAPPMLPITWPTGYDPAGQAAAPPETPARTPCSVDGCDKPPAGIKKSRDYCSGHHARIVRHGDPQADRPLSRSLLLTGQTFGRLKVIREDGRNRHRSVMWLCRCECGADTRVASGELTKGHTKSCGCAITTHGMTGTPLYDRWAGMIARCENPNSSGWHNYGGRGITVCPRWRESFQAFYDDMAAGFREALTLDRINVNGNYEPSNCRWATPYEQARNTRKNRHMTWNGKTLTLGEWASLVGIHPTTISGRLAAGWSLDRALTTPAVDRNASPRVVTWKGQTRTISQWEAMLGGNPNVIRCRLRAGWSVDRALSTQGAQKAG